MDELSIGERITHYQKKYGMSNTALAVRLGVGENTLINYKKKPGLIRLSTAWKMCKLFNVPMAKLFGEER